MIINRGNLLHFYDRIEDQWRYRYGHTGWGILALDSALIAFQVPISPIPAANEFVIKDLAGTTVYTIPTAKITEYCDSDNGDKYFTYDPKAVAGLGTTLDCGFYYVQATIDAANYYSEVLHVVDSAYLAQNNIYRLETWNTNDVGTVLYQNGYTQFVYLEGYWLFPQIDRGVDELENGQGGITLGSAVTKERKRIECPMFHDNWLFEFTLISDNSNTQIRKMNISPTQNIAMIDFRFSYRDDAGGFLSVGLLTWIEGQFSKSGCEEDVTVVLC